MPLLFILFVVMPLVEIYVLIKVGNVIGGFETILVVVATAILGVALLRIQGRQALLNARTKMEVGKVPAREMIDGLFLAVGGLLFLTPGFITDALGFACLIPGIRHILIGAMLSRLKVNTMHFHNGAAPQSDTRERGRVIEGECEREEER